MADAIAGVTASLVSLWTFYPIEVWKTNLQAGSSIGEKSMLKGCWVKSLHTASSSFCYFFLYSWIFENWKRQSPNIKPHPVTRLVLSALAAMLNTIITLPLDVISSKQITQTVSEEITNKEETTSKTILQPLEEHPDTDDSLDFEECRSDECEREKDDGKSPHDQDSSASSVLEVADMEDEDNRCSLWKGLTPSLLLCSNPSIHYTVYDIAKNQILTRGRRKSTQLSMAEAFLVGVFAKFVATIATYPLIRAKVILMVTSEKSLFGSLIRSYNREGVRGLYKGCDWQLLHTVLKSALTMMIREKITASSHQLVFGRATTA